MEFKYNVHIYYDNKITEGLFSDVILSKSRETIINLYYEDDGKFVGQIKLQLSDERLPLVMSFGRDDKYINCVCSGDITLQYIKFNYSFEMLVLQDKSTSNQFYLPLRFIYDKSEIKAESPHPVS